MGAIFEILGDRKRKLPAQCSASQSTITHHRHDKMDIFHSTLSLSQYLTISRNIPQSRLHITRTPQLSPTPTPHLHLTNHLHYVSLSQIQSLCSLCSILYPIHFLYLLSLTPLTHTYSLYITTYHTAIITISPIANITSPIPHFIEHIFT